MSQETRPEDSPTPLPAVQHLGRSLAIRSVPRFLAALSGVSLATCAATAAVAFTSMGLTPALMVVPFAVLSAGAVGLVWPSKLRVGTDGVSVHWYGERRFHSYGDIRTLHPDPRGIRLELVDGEQQIVQCVLDQRRGEEIRDELLEAARARLADYRQHAERFAVSALGRGDRSRGEWFRALDELARQGAGYRGQVVTRAALWAVVDNPALDPTARAGAALVLRRSLKDEERERLRAAAAASAGPQVRVALEAAADEAVELEALDEVVAAVESRVS